MNKIIFNFENRTAVITGGAQGFGFDIARRFLSSGAKVIIWDNDPDTLKKSVKELNNTNLTSNIIDVSKFEEVENCTNEILENSKIDILINNAGSNIRKRPEDLEPEEFRWVLETNLTSAFLCSQAVYPAMKQVGAGKIINIGSMYSIFGGVVSTAYSVSKAGIVQMTKSMATAWAPENIQVNAVLPGWIDTELTQKARKEVDGLYERQLARIPGGRWGNPEDHAGIAVFLASSGSNYITGTAIPVDGGFSISG